MSAYNSSVIDISDSTFRNNVSRNNGGAIYTTGTKLDIKDSIFAGNYTSGASGEGGAIEFDGALTDVSTINNTVFKYNGFSNYNFNY